MKIKVIHPPFNHLAFDLVGHSYIIEVKETGVRLMGKLLFNPDSTPESLALGDDLPMGWGYNVTNGNADGKVFYPKDSVNVLCMVAEDVDGIL